MRFESVKPTFAWDRIWVGFRWEATSRRLFVQPFPALGFVVRFKQPPHAPPGTECGDCYSTGFRNGQERNGSCIWCNGKGVR